jgi:hypothetical protein
MFVVTDIGSTIATTPVAISTQSQASPASASLDGTRQIVCPEQGSERFRAFVTLVAKCLNVRRRFELVRQNTVGHKYSAKLGTGGSEASGLGCGVFIVSMTQSLEKERCAD